MSDNERVLDESVLDESVAETPHISKMEQKHNNCFMIVSIQAFALLIDKLQSLKFINQEWTTVKKERIVFKDFIKLFEKVIDTKEDIDSKTLFRGIRSLLIIAPQVANSFVIASTDSEQPEQDASEFFSWLIEAMFIVYHKYQYEQHKAFVSETTPHLICLTCGNEHSTTPTLNYINYGASVRTISTNFIDRDIYHVRCETCENNTDHKSRIEVSPPNNLEENMPDSLVYQLADRTKSEATFHIPHKLAHTFKQYRILLTFNHISLCRGLNASGHYTMSLFEPQTGWLLFNEMQPKVKGRKINWKDKPLCISSACRASVNNKSASMVIFIRDTEYVSNPDDITIDDLVNQPQVVSERLSYKSTGVLKMLKLPTFELSNGYDAYENIPDDVKMVWKKLYVDDYENNNDDYHDYFDNETCACQKKNCRAQSSVSSSEASTVHCIGCSRDLFTSCLQSDFKDLTDKNYRPASSQTGTRRSCSSRDIAPLIDKTTGLPFSNWIVCLTCYWAYCDIKDIKMKEISKKVDSLLSKRAAYEKISKEVKKLRKAHASAKGKQKKTARKAVEAIEDKRQSTHTILYKTYCSLSANKYIQDETRDLMGVVSSEMSEIDGDNDSSGDESTSEFNTGDESDEDDSSRDESDGDDSSGLGDDSVVGACAVVDDEEKGRIRSLMENEDDTYLDHLNNTIRKLSSSNHDYNVWEAIRNKDGNTINILATAYSQSSSNTEGKLLQSSDYPMNYLN
jgi:hypothetical protein